MLYFKSIFNIYDPYEISTVQRPIRYKVGSQQRLGVKNGCADQALEGETYISTDPTDSTTTIQSE